MEVKFPHELNAEVPILVTLLGIVAFLIEVASNALFGILVILVPIVILDKFVEVLLFH